MENNDRKGCNLRYHGADMSRLLEKKKNMSATFNGDQDRSRSDVCREEVEISHSMSRRKRLGEGSDGVRLTHCGRKVVRSDRRCQRIQGRDELSGDCGTACVWESKGLLGYRQKESCRLHSQSENREARAKGAVARVSRELWSPLRDSEPTAALHPTL